MNVESLFVDGLFQKGIEDLLKNIVLQIDDIERGHVLRQIKVNSLEPFNNYFNQEMKKTIGGKSTAEIGQFIGCLMDKQWKDENFQLDAIEISRNDNKKGEFTVSFTGLKHVVNIHAYVPVAEQGGRHPGPLADVNVRNTHPPHIRKLYCCWYF